MQEIRNILLSQGFKIDTVSLETSVCDISGYLGGDEDVFVEVYVFSSNCAVYTFHVNNEQSTSRLTLTKTFTKVLSTSDLWRTIYNIKTAMTIVEQEFDNQ